MADTGSVSVPRRLVMASRSCARNAVSIPRGLVKAGTGPASKASVPQTLVEVLQAQLASLKGLRRLIKNLQAHSGSRRGSLRSQLAARNSSRRVVHVLQMQLAQETPSCLSLPLAPIQP